MARGSGGKHWTEDQWAENKKIAKSLYEKQGRTIREIAAQMGISYGKAHDLVVESGAVLRPRGGDNRKGK